MSGSIDGGPKQRRVDALRRRRAIIEGKSLGLFALTHSYQVFPEGIETWSEIFAVRAGAFSAGKEAFAVAITSLSVGNRPLRVGNGTFLL